jgi:hypothetical protein
MQATRCRTILIAVAAALALPVLFMGPTLLGGRPLIRDDAALECYPEFQAYAQCLKAGNLYLWDPAQWCGLPALGTAESGGLYPPHLLAFRLLPWQFAIHLCYWLHLSVALLGFFWVARNLGAARGFAVVGGLIYTFSGFAAAHLIHYGFVTGLAHLVLMLAVLQTALLRQSWRWWGLLGLEAALAFLCVQPQIYLMSLFAGLLWVVSGGWWRETTSLPGRPLWRRTVAGLVVSGLLGALLVMPQSLPELQLSVRAGAVAAGAGDAQGFIASYPFRLVDLPRIVFPNLYGTIHDSVTGAGPVFHETSAFVGVAVLMLGAAGLVLARRQRAYLFLVVLFLVGVALIPSGNPIYQLVARVPVLNGFRAMGRWAVLPILGLALLASLGLGALPRGEEREHRRARAAAGLVAGVVLLPLLLLWVTFGMESGSLALPGSGATLPPESLSRVIYNWLVGWEPLLALGAAGLALAALFVARRRSLCLALALLATGLPLWQYWQTVNQPGPRDYYTRPPQTAQTILQRGGGRLTTLPPALVCATEEWRHRGRLEPQEIERELLSAVFGLPFGLSYGDGYRHRLSTPATYRLWQDYFRYGTQAFTGVVSTTTETVERVGTPAERMKRMHRLCGVQFIVTPGDFTDPDLPIAHEGPVRVYQYRRSHPQAWLVGRTRVIADPEKQLATIKRRDFDPETEAVVEAEVRGLTGEVVDGKAEIRRRYLETLVTTEASARALLVLADAWYPGWQAFVDGRPAPLLRANYAFRAVPVPAGSHQVTFRYQPSHWVLALALMALGLLLLAATLGKRKTPAQGRGPGKSARS